MIQYTNVTREFKSLVHRRRQLMTFLGSLFAATSLFLHNVLRGRLAAALEGLKEYVFALYALLLMVPALLLALRMARLHGGMVLNGMLYARLMQQQDFTRKGDPEKAGRHNWFGVSFLQFLLTALLAGFSAALLAIAVDVPPPLALAVGAGVVLLWLALYFRFHHQAAAFARRKIASDTCGTFDRKDWQGHVSASLEDANAGMLSEIAFVGLMI